MIEQDPLVLHVVARHFRDMAEREPARAAEWLRHATEADEIANALSTPSVCDPNTLTGTCRWDHDHEEDPK